MTLSSFDFDETWDPTEEYPALRGVKNCTDDEGERDDRPSLDVTGDGNPATDTTGDGLLDDVDGNGETNIFDVQACFDNLESEAIQENAEQFDFSETGGEVGIFDVQALFGRL